MSDDKPAELAMTTDQFWERFGPDLARAVAVLRPFGVGAVAEAAAIADQRIKEILYE